MGMQEILFEIPERIRLGLATGDLRRFGGVIRDVHGRIVCHLKEIGIFNEVENISKKLTDIGNQLTGIQQMQTLQLAGIGMVAVISVIGFVQINKQLGEVRNQLLGMEETLAEIKEVVKLLHLENVIQIANGYYRSIAAFAEGDFQEAFLQARNCSADINNYIENIPYEKLLNDENTLLFLSKLLVATMQAQISAVRNLGSNDIANILNRYKVIFNLLYSIIEQVKSKFKTSLPTGATLKLLKRFSNKETYLSRLNKALPISIGHLENEQRFLELCPSIQQHELLQAKNSGKEVILVMEPELREYYVTYHD